MNDLKETENLIKGLSSNLGRPGRLRPPWMRAGVFFFSLLISVIFVSRAIQIFRPGFMEQVLTFGRLFWEISSGFLFAFFLTLIVFKKIIPGEPVSKGLQFLTGLWGIVFLSTFFWSFFQPSPSPSSLGARPFCEFEVIIYGSVALLILFGFLKKGFFRISGLFLTLTGLAVSLIPATLMQVACLYNPEHALVFHYGPMVFVVIASLLVGRKVFRP